MADNHAKEVSERNCILRGVVGSTVHGLAIDGQDDRDEMGIFIEPPANVCGLQSCDHYVYRDQPTGVRSRPGDLDLTMYSLRKYCRLAAGGNPSVLLMLYLPNYITKTSIGEKLIDIRNKFISYHAGKAFLGYLTAQKQKMMGHKAHTVNRPELVALYGYDTKFAMHALRLGYQGIEYMKDGKITLPCTDNIKSLLRSVRLGETPEAHALDLIQIVEIRLKQLVDKCTHKADYDGINKFLVEAHSEHWNEKSIYLDKPGTARADVRGNCETAKRLADAHAL